MIELTWNLTTTLADTVRLYCAWALIVLNDGMRQSAWCGHSETQIENI